MIRILHLEDSIPDHRLISARLRAEHVECEISRVDTDAQFRAALSARCPDLILADYRLPGFDGRAALRIAQKLCPEVPFLLLTGAIGETSAVEMLQAGATDYILKDDHDRLVPAIRRALAEAQLRQGRQAAERALRENAALLSDFFDNATIGLHWLGPDGVILRANRAELALLGYTQEEYVGRHIADFHADREFVDDMLARLQRGEEGGEREARLRRKDGTFRQVAIACSVLRDTAGHLVHVRCFTRDITKKRQAEEEARVRTEQLRLIADTAPVFIAHCDTQHHYKFVNEPYATRFGLTRDRVIGRHVSEVVGEAAYGSIRPHMERVLAGEAHEFEVALAYDKIGPHHMHCAYVPERDADGRVVGFVAAIIDISGRKRAEQAMRESEERYRSLFESIDEGFCVIEIIVDEAGQPVDSLFVQASPSFERQTGFAAVVGRRASEIFAHNDPEWLEIYGGVMRTGQPVRLERYSPELGRWLEVHAYRVGPAERRQVAVLFNDATARRTVEAARRQNEALFSKIIEQAPGGVYVVNGEFRISQVNALARPVFAHAEPVLGRDFNEVICILWGAQLGAEITAIFRHTLETGERYVSPRFTHQRVDLQAEQSYEWEIQRISLPDGHHGVVCYFTDVTERLRANAALRAAKEAAEATSASKDRFIAALSHELRTPLTPVLMTVGALEHDPDLRADLRADLAMIRRNIELETKLIDDLLDVSRIASGKIVLRLAPLDLHDAVAQAGEICRPQAREQGVRLEVTVGRVPCPVVADAARLQQVLWNVIKNAVKFTPAQGTVRVSTARLDATHCEVRVSDTGIGISAEALPKIFDAFEQGDPGITRQFGGLGLGLAIARALIELHGGQIRAESAGRGLGATFTLRLPVAPQAPSTALVETPPPATAPGAGPVRLLVVEDHANTARALRVLLTRNGHVVRHAADVASALELARRETFDLFITDIGLPDGTGYDVMTGLKEIQPLPGLVMSGFGSDEDLQRSREAGFAEHLVKPFDIPQLLAAVARTTGTGR